MSQELVNSVNKLTDETSALLQEYVKGNTVLQNSASEAASSAAAAKVSEGITIDKANVATQKAAEAKQFRDETAAVATGGTATLDPTPGKIPLANAEAKLHAGWLPVNVSALSDAIVEAIRGENKEQYAASGFIHYGQGYSNNVNSQIVNEGLWSNETFSNVLRLGRGNVTTGSSKTTFPVTHIAGFTSKIFGVNQVDEGIINSIKFPQAPNGTVVYDSTGNCRGTGKPTLDLSKEVDPKYGNVADSVNEAVARAFEGMIKNGDFRNDGDQWIVTGAAVSFSDGVAHFNGDVSANIRQGNTDFVDGDEVIIEVVCQNTLGYPQLSIRQSGGNENFPMPESGRYEFKTTINGALESFEVWRSSAVTPYDFEIHSVSVRRATEEVVINRVDMAGLEFSKQKAREYLYPYGMIQSKATTVDGVATTEDTVRPITYFAVFEGDTTSRGRGWKLADLTFVQLATIMSNPDHNAWYNEAGELIQFRCRQRTIAGLGNGDWGATNIGINAAKDRYLGFATNTFVHAQGALDTVTAVNSVTSRIYESNVSGHTDEVGVYKVNNDSGATAVDGECYFYVLATVPRLNQGAYHPSFNPMGCEAWRSNSGYGVTWTGLSSGGQAVGIASHVSISVAGAFNINMNGHAKGTPGDIPRIGIYGDIKGVANGFPRSDGRAFDAIYASGQGGVIDWRLPARDMSGKEEAAKVFQKVVNGTYRGLERLPLTKFVDAADAEGSMNKNIYWHGGSNPTGLTAKDAIVGSAIAAVYEDGTSAHLGFVGKHLSDSSVEVVDANGKGIAVKRTSNRYMITYYTNISVSGNFTTLDVVGSPEEILATPALANGWIGRRIPKIPDGSTGQALTRKRVDSGNINRTYTTNNGVTWTSNSVAFDTVTNSDKTTAWSADAVNLYGYTAFAKQTKNSTNKPVLNGSDGLGDVIADSVYHTQYGALLVESLIGKVPTNDRAPELTYLTLTKRMVNPSGAMNDASVHLPKHEPVDITAPTNNSPAVKALWCQASNNQQATLNFLWNEMVFDTNWRTPDKVWSGGSVSVAVGETFRAESSSAYAVAGLLMRCVKAVTANASVLGAMHVSVGGDVISLSDGQTYFKVVNNGWSDDSTIRIIDGVGTFNNENGDTCLYGTDELAMSYGYTKNQAGAGKQVVGVDL
ncbi:TPA: hypothetical protein KDX54_000093 [Vibrio vulnificus]|nr:hypothetical protein [Vibrio vulnificus]